MRTALTEHDQAAIIAVRAAQLAYEPDKSDTWRLALTRHSTASPTGQHAGVLAMFVAENPEAPAEALYRFGVGVQVGKRPWTGAEPRMRVACEVFRATFLAAWRVLRTEAEMARAPLPPATVVPLPDRGQFRRTFARRQSSLATRSRLIDAPRVAPAGTEPAE